MWMRCTGSPPRCCRWCCATLPDLRALRSPAPTLPSSIRALASANVEVLGWVADLDALFGQVRLSVAPLRYGAGFKGKVATSLAHGVPVVGTAIALEGTGLAPGDGIALADDAAAFADEVVRLHEDEAVWTALAATAAAALPRAVFAGGGAGGLSPAADRPGAAGIRRLIGPAPVSRR